MVWEDRKMDLFLEEQKNQLDAIMQNAVVDEDANGPSEEAMQIEQEQIEPPVILPQYQSLYEMNSDIIGWLTIPETVIDYPVMQTPEDEQFYLYLDFNKEENKNGCLIMDTDSTVGIGKADNEYQTEKDRQPI